MCLESVDRYKDFHIPFQYKWSTKRVTTQDTQALESNPMYTSNTQPLVVEGNEGCHQLGSLMSPMLLVARCLYVDQPLTLVLVLIKWKSTWACIDEDTTWHPTSAQLWRSSWTHLLVKRRVQPIQSSGWLWHWRLASTTIRFHTLSRAYLCGIPKRSWPTPSTLWLCRIHGTRIFHKGENAWSQQLF